MAAWSEYVLQSFICKHTRIPYIYIYIYTSMRPFICRQIQGPRGSFLLGAYKWGCLFQSFKGVKKNQIFHSRISAERNSYWRGWGGGERPIALLPIQYTVIKETCCSLTIIGEVPAPRPTHYCVSGGKKGLTERFPS